MKNIGISTRLFVINLLTITVLTFLNISIPVIGKKMLSLTNVQIGLLMAISVLASMSFRFLVGKHIDEKGELLPVVTGVVLAISGVLLFALKISYLTYFLGRIINGIGFFLIIISTIISLSKNTGTDAYVKEFSKFGITYYIPVFYAPALALYLLNKDMNIIFYLSAVLYLVVLFIFPFRKKNQPFKQEVKHDYHRKAFPALLIFPLTVFDGAIWTFFIIYMMQIKHGGAVSVASKFFFILSSVVILTKILISRRAPQSRISQYKTVILGLVLIVSGGSVLAFKLSSVFYLFPLLYGIGFGIADSYLISLTLSSYPAFAEGMAISVYSIFFDLGWIFGSFILGFVADIAGYANMYKVALAFPVTALITAAVFALHRPGEITVERP